MHTLIDESPTHQLPPLDYYWNPGPETLRERRKLQVLHALATTGGFMGHALGRRAKASIGILTYHRVSNAVRGVPFPTVNVTANTLRRQLSGLQRSGFHFVSLSSVLDACQKTDCKTDIAPLPEKTVVVTFDDIYDNMFLNAWPVLQELNIPATIFVSTGFIDLRRPFLFGSWANRHFNKIPEDSWRPITSRHIKEMLQSGLIELGAHTHSHQDFRDRTEAFAVDVAIGVQQLQKRFAVDRLSFAFPYGSPRLGFTSRPLMDAVKDLGLRCGLTTGSHVNRHDSSPFGWGRFHVFEHDTTTSLAAKLDGWYEWLPSLKDRLMGHAALSKAISR